MRAVIMWYALEFSLELFLTYPLQLYAAGNLTDDNKVLIDIGTGYYVEKVSFVAQLIMNTILSCDWGGKVENIAKKFRYILNIRVQEFCLKLDTFAYIWYFLCEAIYLWSDALTSFNICWKTRPWQGIELRSFAPTLQSGKAH